MEPLPRIPVPLRQCWREFRVAYLPPLTFVVMAAAIAWMWGQYVHPPTVVGEVEAVRANVISVLPGTIEELRVDLCQRVTNGQELVVLSIVDQPVLDAELAALEADIQLTKARMDVDKTRNQDSLIQLRANLLSEKINFQNTRIRLQQVESEFQRAEMLLEQQVVAKGGSAARNDFGYDVALRDRDLVRNELTNRTALLDQLEQGLHQLESAGIVQVTSNDPAVQSAIRAQRERVQQLQKPVLLRAPIDGFVSAVRCRPGEKVTAGQPILVISGNRAERIIGWVRQPVRFRPAVGDAVEVRSTGANRPALKAVVAEVGEQLEPISLTALPPNTPANHVELGLQFMVHPPGGADLIPGETVEVILKTTHGRSAD